MTVYIRAYGPHEQMTRILLDSIRGIRPPVLFVIVQPLHDSFACFGGEPGS